MNNSTLKKIAFPMVEKVAANCPWLDSDGLSNIMHAYLDRHQLPVVHHRGFIQARGCYFIGHDWLTLGCWTIDYHAHTLYPWVEVPRGMFRASEFPLLTYSPRQLVTVCPPHLVKMLERPRPLPDFDAFTQAMQLRFEGKEIPSELHARVQEDLDKLPLLKSQFTPETINLN